MQLSRCLRMPIRVGSRVLEVPCAARAPRTPDPGGEDFPGLVDAVNLDHLTRLERAIPGPAHRLAYVRGSVIKDRLEEARTRWPRVVELFRLRPLLTRLAQEIGCEPVAEFVRRVRGLADRQLLYDGRKLAVAKLAFRTDRPDAAELGPEDWPQIEAFLAGFSALSVTVDQPLRGTLETFDLADALRAARKGYPALLGRFGLDAVAEQLPERFDALLEAQRESRCLHPLLPVEPRAVDAVAEAISVDPREARQALLLLRFACFCVIKKPTEYSDIALKNVVVIPQRSDDPDAVQRDAERALEAAIGALEETTRSEPRLGRLLAAHPRVRATNMASVLSLPPALFELFGALDPQRGRFDFLSRYRMGRAFLAAQVRELDGAAAGAETLRAIATRHRDALGSGLDASVARSLQIRIGRGEKGYVKHEVIEPCAATPEGLARAVRRAIEAPGEEPETLARWFEEVSKDDFEDSIRGLWSSSEAARV